MKDRIIGLTKEDLLCCEKKWGKLPNFKVMPNDRTKNIF